MHVERHGLTRNVTAGDKQIPTATPPRILCVQAHPDDETIWTGGTLARHCAAGGQADVVTTTWATGAPRHRELVDALATLGLPRPPIMLGYADGGVADSSALPALVDAAFDETVAALTGHVRALRPEAHIDGFMVEPMAARRDSWELIVGATQDPQFGPVLLFGQGGTAVEVVRDQSLELPPLNMKLARALIDRTRVARLLAGWRDVPPADSAAVVGVLKHLVCDHKPVLKVIDPLAEVPHQATALR